MKIKGDFRCHLFALVLIFVGFQVSVHGRLLSVSKPDPDDAAATARWLVSQNNWGIAFDFFLLGIDHCKSQLIISA
ncbi:hypothetical protein CK203_010899 [Vitis vinifera]|uniref:Uncharacterized protein n=1 Tax=Vitis vinifera TaxID=29760 RepID=A0A438JIU0_VITVI|nr:hypothetical protein CK203_010899 [Vitis vinifera]